MTELTGLMTVSDICGSVVLAEVSVSVSVHWLEIRSINLTRYWSAFSQTW